MISAPWGDPIDHDPEETHTCEHEGCTYDAIACYLPDYFDAHETPPDEPDDWYCGEHAPQHGYCACCGSFWGGIESFDMRASGLCDNCHDEFEREYEDEDDWGDE